MSESTTIQRLPFVLCLATSAASICLKVPVLGGCVTVDIVGGVGLRDGSVYMRL